jgi:hypothetical protein
MYVPFRTLLSYLQGFTNACHATTPFTVMTFLNDLYSRFDGLVDIYKVYKVETIGGELPYDRCRTVRRFGVPYWPCCTAVQPCADDITDRTLFELLLTTENKGLFSCQAAAPSQKP